MLLDKARTDNHAFKICSQQELSLLHNKELKQEDFTKPELIECKPCKIFGGITMNEAVNERNLNQHCNPVYISPNTHPK